MCAHAPPLPLNSQSFAFNSQAGKHLSLSSDSTDACAQLRFASDGGKLFEKGGRFDMQCMYALCKYQTSQVTQKFRESPTD